MPSKKAHKLPIGQLAILSICRFAEPVALTSVLPYVPEMIESFNVPQTEVGRWVGYSSAIFSVAQAFTAIAWGRASDIWGRKSIILIGLVNTSAALLLWGFSTNLAMSMVARALQGAMNGNVGIIRTMVAEMCPWKDLQPRAFSVMPLVWNFGSVFGPALGGLLSNPYHVNPKHPHGNSLLEKFPYALPNIVITVIFVIGITTGFFFLEETLEGVKDKRDIGIIFGNKFMAMFKSGRRSVKEEILHIESEPLLKDQEHRPDDEESDLIDNPPSTKPAKDVSAPTIREVVNFQSALVLIVYTLLALFDIGYNQLLPVFLYHHPTPEEEGTPQYPFRFNKGLSLKHTRIGLFFAISGLLCWLIQLTIFPPIARRYGSLRCLRACLLIYPLMFALTPYSALFPTAGTQQAAVLTCFLVKQFASIFMFPCTVILLTNSASSVRILGTLNGVATSVSALGRAGGPALAGELFSWGTKNKFVTMPFFVLAGIAALASVPAWWMEEGKGIIDEDEDEEDEVAEAESGVVTAVERNGRVSS